MALGDLAGIGSIVSAFIGSDSQKKTNEANRQIARENNAFQASMANNAHQRQVADLEAAGLNPVLAAGGSGAASPQGSVAKMENPDRSERIAEGLQKMTSNSMAAKALSKELQSKDSQIALNEAGRVTQATQAQLNTSNALKAQTDAKRSALEASALESQLPGIKIRAEKNLKQDQFDLNMLQYDNIMNRVKTAGGIVTDAVGAFMPKIKIQGTDRVIDKATGELLKESRYGKRVRQVPSYRNY